jgi:hypothetical protein
MVKTMQLAEPVCMYLRLTDSNTPSAPLVVKYGLDILAAANAWDKACVVAFTEAAPKRASYTE